MLKEKEHQTNTTGTNATSMCLVVVVARSVGRRRCRHRRSLDDFVSFPCSYRIAVVVVVVCRGTADWKAKDEGFPRSLRLMLFGSLFRGTMEVERIGGGGTILMPLLHAVGMKVFQPVRGWKGGWIVVTSLGLANRKRDSNGCKKNAWNKRGNHVLLFLFWFGLWVFWGIVVDYLFMIPKLVLESHRIRMIFSMIVWQTVLVSMIQLWNH